MRKQLTYGLLSLFLIFSSCKSTGPKGAAGKQEQAGRDKITKIETQQASNNVKKLESIASLSWGVSYALGKIQEPSREVSVALDVNSRVMSLAGTPVVEKLKEMQITIDNLVSQIEENRLEGEKQLNKKDKEIISLQEETKYLIATKDNEIKKYMSVAQDAAANSDEYKTKLKEYTRWFGLKGVYLGMKQFITSAMWVLGIGSILFIVLRVLSYSNPFTAAIFTIFDRLGSWFVHGINLLLPKAIEFAGHTANDVVGLYKNTLRKIVDGIQLIKDRAKTNGTNPSLQDVLIEIAKTMNEDEKQVVAEIKQELNWK